MELLVPSFKILKKKKKKCVCVGIPQQFRG